MHRSVLADRIERVSIGPRKNQLIAGRRNPIATMPASFREQSSACAEMSVANRSSPSRTNCAFGRGTKGGNLESPATETRGGIMKTRNTRRLSFSLLLSALSLLALTSLPAAAVESADQTTKSWPWEYFCRLQFDLAQRTDMESFRDYDADTFRAGHTEDAVTVFSSGAMRIGIDAIMQALAGHFDGREAIWEWTELNRHVQGCRTAHILYETHYRIPRINLDIHALTGVTYTYKNGLWLSNADQGTVLSNPTP
jgi:hypothetical protein